MHQKKKRDTCKCKFMQPRYLYLLGQQPAQTRCIIILSYIYLALCKKRGKMQILLHIGTDVLLYNMTIFVKFAQKLKQTIVRHQFLRIKKGFLHFFLKFEARISVLF